MKKIVSIVLIVVLFLTACSSPEFPMSEQHEKYGKKALEIVDAYLDFDLTADEAEAKLDSLRKSESTLPADTSEEETGNLLVRSSVMNLCSSFYFLKNNSKTSNDILELRNHLAQILGKDKR